MRKNIYSLIVATFFFAFTSISEAYDPIGAEKVVSNVISLKVRSNCYNSDDDRSRWEAPSGWEILGHNLNIIGTFGKTRHNVSTSAGNKTTVSENYIKTSFNSLLDAAANIKDGNKAKEISAKIRSDMESLLDARSRYMSSHSAIELYGYCEGVSTITRPCSSGGKFEATVNVTIKKILADEDVSKMVESYHTIIAGLNK
ncbi:hypothetical protein HMY34_09635 [Thiothrix subterranea]|uniref:hypothetical protein n=1 Tax=Thiothrix subterranea TaxID=2735563 RepID=UPI00192B7A2C|nr:hypothetical protein [Thiothrix subterranea]QQZ28994.1 hypothetical protein HMY34_09635 [Thiothrix subterranea]